MEPDEMRLVAEFAALAPSVHNTQPWHFVAERHTLQVHRDPHRSLSYLDPDGRQATLSCGAAVEFARLAIRSLGSACTVRLLPAPEHPTLLATLTVGHSEPTTPAEQRLIDAIPRRYTDRGHYDAEPVPPAVLNLLRDAAADRGCWLRVLDRPGDRVTAITLLADAEGAETRDEAYQEELETWRRSVPSPDGVPVAAFAAQPDRSWATDVPLRDFDGTAADPAPDWDDPPSIERDMMALLGTDGDDRISWLRAGRGLAGILLVLTDADLACQPLGPVMDIPATRFRLRQDLGLIGHPQMLLRVGHGHGRPFAGRRKVDDTFEACAAP